MLPSEPSLSQSLNQEILLTRYSDVEVKKRRKGRDDCRAQSPTVDDTRVSTSPALRLRVLAPHCQRRLCRQFSRSYSQLPSQIRPHLVSPGAGQQR
jgi:hypothetical protein